MSAKRVRLAGLSFAASLRRTAVSNRALAVKRVTEIATAGVDLVCLPEAFTALGVEISGIAEIAETVPGPTTDALAAVARAHRCHVVCPIYTYRSGRYYNSAVILDRAGQIAGIYDKAHPRASDARLQRFELGVTPGTSRPWFDLDFGRVGVQICMDAWFPATWAKLAEARVELVVWPSAYDGALTMQAFAALHHFYILTGVRRGCARLIDPVGRVVAASGDARGRADAVVALDYVVVADDPRDELPSRARAAYGEHVEVQRVETEGVALLVSYHPERSAAELARSLGASSLFEDCERHLRAYAERG